MTMGMGMAMGMGMGMGMGTGLRHGMGMGIHHTGSHLSLRSNDSALSLGNLSNDGGQVPNPNQTKPSHAKRNETKLNPNRTKPDQIRLNQAKPNKT